MRYSHRATLTTGILAIYLIAVFPAIPAAIENSDMNYRVTRNLTSMPLTYTENRGQWDENVLFRADAGGATMWFTKGGAVFQFTRRIERTERVGAPPSAGPESLKDMVGSERHDNKSDSIESISIKANLIGANPNPQLAGSEMMEYKCNYFFGNDPNEWHTDVPSYEAIIYDEIYSGIDLKYYGNGKQMEYDFIVSPRSDPSQIAIKYEGITSLSVNAGGGLVVGTEWGEVVEHKPIVYQLRDGVRELIECVYEITGDNIFGFSLPKNHDSELPLVIDPVLSYSTFLGGSGSDNGYSIAVDESGNSYITGVTESEDFPLDTEYQADQPNEDIFVTRLNSDGTGLHYSTYVGGSARDFGYGIDIDDGGNAYITGHTNSSDFPILGEYQVYQGSNDVFVTKLNSTGNALVYSTYFGGTSLDYGRDIFVDGSGNAYFTGYTNSSNFPTEGEYQTYQGDDDIFVTKLNSAGSAPIFSTYLGGSLWDVGYAITVDDMGYAYITGATESLDFPIVGAPMTPPGLDNAFVTKLDISGSEPVYSVFLGGSSLDRGYDIAVDNTYNAYVTGKTASENFPIRNEFQTHQGYFDVFVTKLNGTGNDLIYSTFLGGTSLDMGQGITVDNNGHAFITGESSSSGFPLKGEIQTNQGLADVFVTILGDSGSDLIFSTYVGGSDDDVGCSVEIDTFGNVYITGHTVSTNFPTETGYQINHQGGFFDAFVLKLTYDDNCCIDYGKPGDADKSGMVNLTDTLDAISYVYVLPLGEPQAADGCNALYDVNGDGTAVDIPNVNLTDILDMISHVYVVPLGEPVLCCPPGCMYP